MASMEDADVLDKGSNKHSECCEMAINYSNLALQDSLWMLLMDFPAWLQFACLSLFQKPTCFHEGHDNNHGVGFGNNEDADGLEHLTLLSHQEIAARYIAWHFSPLDQKLKDMVVRMLREVAQSWLCIKGNKCPGREEKQEGPAVKRRKLMDESEMYSDKPKAVEGRIGEIERAQSGPERTDALGYTDLLKGGTEAVQKWLMNFQDCCRLLDSYSQGGSHHVVVAANKQQAKRRLVMGVARNECTLTSEQDSQQPEATLSQCKRSSFFDTFPLVALLCSPHLHNDAVVHLILHVIMAGSGFSSMKGNVSGVKETSADGSTSGNDSFAYQEARRGPACREPSHRTEDFRDMCEDPFCLYFSLHTSSFAASGVARVFKSLEMLDLLEDCVFANGCNGRGWLGGFKEIIARQLQMCISRWSQHVDNTRLTVLDDLRRRAASWAGRTGLENQTLRAFNQVLQRLDILIASSVVGDGDTLVDA